MDFSLLYFANREVTDTAQEYELLVKSAEFADSHDFTAVWLPERHFHSFGGAYPNPALAAAVLAARTQRIRLRAGSVVVPLHDPLSVVEDWSFVDNISEGRVDIALASGWHPNDFVLAPDRYAVRREFTFGAVNEITDLWAGKKIWRRNGKGEEVETTTFPRPVQAELGLWLTCSRSPETFDEAGARGLNVLTALMFQGTDKLAENIERYRTVREQHGHDPAAGKVTLMLHTFVSENDNAVRAAVRGPFTEYLLSSSDLWKAQYLDFQGSDPKTTAKWAFERYFHRAALFGSVDRCTSFARELHAAGVDEIASLIDFGVEHSAVLTMLPHLDEVRRKLNGSGLQRGRVTSAS
ncbi:MupA/Atu3671 family FMN-dependent luciferase-like monooxygenase [Streptomyces luteogriseus]|uniref:MupA/Atu3671 family FMN-dependent luciferase-like monooxygenase n=1 Tax=Streptomyces luteogriseus TaxID=68233 RepID=UPI0037BB557F